ncbi:MAG: flagellar hook-basal body complex protein FliE [Aquificae bacterium]|nr:flagellar hook-basal body complex protein FliE [Aquificota bacterium]
MKIENIDLLKITVEPSQKPKTEEKFSHILKEFIAQINNDQLKAKEAEQKIIKGEVNNLEELMYTIQKSEISLRLITEIRNKALESYQEIFRMQV